jgi:hypothetical protein
MHQTTFFSINGQSTSQFGQHKVMLDYSGRIQYSVCKTIRVAFYSESNAKSNKYSCS